MIEQHLIDTLSMSFDFDCAQKKQHFEGQAIGYAKTRLLAVIERVFDRFSQTDEILRIETLTIDLGDCQSDDYLNDMERALEQSLSTQLHQQLMHADRAVVKNRLISAMSTVSNLNKISAQQSRQTTLYYYLTRGTLPWHSVKSTAPGWLEHEVTAQMDALIGYLSTAQHSDAVVARRLFYQLSTPTIILLISRLSNARQAIFFDVLKSDPRVFNHPTLKSCQIRWWQAYVDQGFAQLPEQDLYQYWQELLLTQSPLLLRNLKLQGVQAERRQALVISCGATIFTDILCLLEPTEHTFVSAFIKHSVSIDMSNEKTLQVCDRGKQQHVLWLFSLDYLLLERGSGFNRKSYLLSVLKQLATHNNSDELSILTVLENTLNKAPKYLALALQMLHVVEQLKVHVMASRTVSVPLTADKKVLHSTDPRSRQLSHYFSVGKLASLVTNWPKIRVFPPILIRQLFMQQAQIIENVMQNSDPQMRNELVAILQPELPFVMGNVTKAFLQVWHFVTALPACQLSYFQMSALNTHTLWRIALDFCVEQLHTSSVKMLNQACFLQYLIQKVSLLVAITEQQCSELLHTKKILSACNNDFYGYLQKALTYFDVKASAPSHQKKLASITPIIALTYTQLGADEQAAVSAMDGYFQVPSTAPAGSWYKLFVQALTQGHSAQLATYWPTLKSLQPQLLQTLLTHYGQQSDIRQRWATYLHDNILADFIILLLPNHYQEILTTVDQSLLFALALDDKYHNISEQPRLLKVVTQSLQGPPQAAVKHSLWQVSLTYLLVERGSEFNKKSYLTSVLRQLANHHNVDYTLLLHTMSILLQALASAQNNALLMHIKALMQDKTPPQKSLIVAKKGEAQQVYYQLLQRINKSSNRGDVIESTLSTEVLWEQLKQRQPLLLQRFLQYGLNMRIDWCVLTDALSIESLAKVLIQVIRLTNGAVYLGMVNTEIACVQLQKSYRLLPSDTLKRQYISHLLTQMNLKKTMDVAEYVARLMANEVHAQVPHEAMLSSTITHLKKKLKQSAVLQEGLDVPLLASDLGLKKALDVHSVTQIINRYIRKITQNKGPDSSVITPAFMQQVVVAIEYMLRYQVLSLTQFIAQCKQSPVLIKNVIKHLPEPLFIQLLRTIQPAHVQNLLLYSEALTQLAHSYLYHNTPHNKQVSMADLTFYQYYFLFTYVTKNNTSQSVADFILDFSNYLTLQLGERFQTDAINTVANNKITLSTTIKTTLIAHLAPIPPQQKIKIIKQPIAMPPQKAVSITNKVFAVDNDSPLLPSEPDSPRYLQKIDINNAGLVLTSVYLPRLFDMFSLTREQAFINQKAAYKAVHLLNFIVQGEAQVNEFELALNKLLCGIALAEPVPREHELSATEKTNIEGMLHGMINNWHALGNTSVDGLRETFLQRKGQLWQDDKQWQLNVQEESFDMLLEQLPWTFSLIKHAWMAEPLYVQWR
ncbi:MAG: contractile injection system tape measure protein [Psychromonas sp.]